MRGQASVLTAGLVVLAGLSLTVTSPVQAGTRLDLDGPWQFRIDPQRQGSSLGWTREVPHATETVDVPHTWGIGKYDDYEGTAWYFKTFEVPPALVGRHAEIHFGATFYRSRVWLNGEELGGHEGGYTEYFFDVTHHLKASNVLAVELDNRPGDATIPGYALRLRGSDDSSGVWYDWWHYGGIVRDAWLTVGDPVLVRRQQIRSTPNGSAASVESRVFLENASPEETPVVLTMKVLPPGGVMPVATVERRLTLSPGAHDESVSLDLEAPELWHFDHPHLYRMVAELRDAHGALVDSRTDSFGIRRIEIRGRQLFLNGEHVRLTGITRHEDSVHEGLAETRGTIRDDYDDLKNLQVTLTRPVHYPQNPAILDYCDRHGILLIPEIPMWQFSGRQMQDPRVVALAKQMMREMIEQDFNHPSIMGWSLCNESDTATPGGLSYVETMSAWVRALDPDRLVSFADDALGRAEAEDAIGFADFIMMNQYYGSWHGPADALPSVLDRVGKLYPDKMVIISEFGLAGVFAADSATADAKRVAIIRDQLATFGKYDWIGGALLWCYQDYKSHRNLWPGETAGWVDHGLVDKDRQRRPSYDVWRELNFPISVDLTWRASDQFPHTPVGFSARISRRGPLEIPSYPLEGYSLSWTARGEHGQTMASGTVALRALGEPTEVEGRWTAAAPPAVALAVKVTRPTGAVAFERTFAWRGPATGGESVGDMKRRGYDVPPPGQ